MSYISGKQKYSKYISASSWLRKCLDCLSRRRVVGSCLDFLMSSDIFPPETVSCINAVLLLFVAILKGFVVIQFGIEILHEWQSETQRLLHYFIMLFCVRLTCCLRYAKCRMLWSYNNFVQSRWSNNKFWILIRISVLNCPWISLIELWLAVWNVFSSNWFGRMMDSIPKKHISRQCVFCASERIVWHNMV